LFHLRASFAQLLAIARAELLEALGLVVEPLAQLAAGRQLAGPIVELGPLAGDPARPQPVDEHAIAIAALHRGIDALAGDAHLVAPVAHLLAREAHLLRTSARAAPPLSSAARARASRGRSPRCRAGSRVPPDIPAAAPRPRAGERRRGSSTRAAAAGAGRGPPSSGRPRASPARSRARTRRRPSSS